jgi:toxin ParE1/3/4
MKVRFTKPAQRDVDQIYAYISQDSPTVASRFVARLVERARQLADHPFEGMQTDDQIRGSSWLRYFIFYTLAADEIHITHIRHMSRRRPRGWNR